MLKLIYNNIIETYDNLLIKNLQPSMEIKLLRTLGMEIFKTLNDINPNYMKKNTFIYLLMKHVRKMTYLFIVAIKQNIAIIL